MVARTPPKQLMKVVVPPPLNPILLRETVNKVEKCMARLQELQYTVTVGTKMISGVTLSPRSTRGYLQTSLRCKQESIRMKKNVNSRRSSDEEWEWRRMSLPAMLLGETMGEIVEASEFARNIVEAVSSKTKKPIVIEIDDPKTPLAERRLTNPENTQLRARRKREKQVALQTMRSESDDNPTLQRAKSRINFKRECDKENCRYIANRVSPRNRPWARKTVLFPNPLFHSSPTSQHQKFCKTKSPVIASNNKQVPHKFLIKSPPPLPSASKFQVKIRSPPLSISPTRAATNIIGKKSPKVSAAAKLRRSFSPSRIANRLVSPLKGRKSVQKNDAINTMSGLKQRPISTPVRFLPRRM